MPTTVFLVNASGAEVDLKTTVFPALEGKYWQPGATSMPASQRSVEALRFDREEGISYGKSWTFTTLLTIDGVLVSFQERIQGEATTSSLEQCMTAGGKTTGFQNTSKSVTIQFTGNRGTLFALTWILTQPHTASFYDIQYVLRVAKQAPIHYVTTKPVMTQIKTVVYLMLENRSLDNVLGWLYEKSMPARFYPEKFVGPRKFQGIPAGASNMVGGQKFEPSRGTSGGQSLRIPHSDPHEAFPNVKKQLYADGNGTMPSGDYWKDPPPMSGFAWDYQGDYDDTQHVMGAYTPAQLPVLNGLAAKFAVSDYWFSSAPTQTNPNRAFSICGTSLGALVNSEMDQETYAGYSTIFNALGDNGKTWGLYWQEDNPLVTGTTSWTPYTQYYFSRMKEQVGAGRPGRISKYQDFFADLETGHLPDFCFLEPFWGGGKGDRTSFAGMQGNDYHPPAWVGPAEADLNELYEKIVSSRYWRNMLFVITFDEHGGTYDHVPPTRTIAPDAFVGDDDFRFERLGVRVPTILVSPYVEAGTVFRRPLEAEYDYDHTSFLATMLKWAGVQPASAGLGARTGVAPTFEGVLQDMARTDTPRFQVPKDYATQGGGTGAWNPRLDEQPGRVLDVTKFREAEEASETAEEFLERIEALPDQEA